MSEVKWDSIDTEKAKEFSQDYTAMESIRGYDDFGDFMRWIDNDDSSTNY